MPRVLDVVLAELIAAEMDTLTTGAAMDQEGGLVAAERHRDACERYETLLAELALLRSASAGSDP